MSPLPKVLTVAAVAGGLVLALHAPAFAHDCADAHDCYDSTRAIIAAWWGLVGAMTGLFSMALNFIPGVGFYKGAYEAATGRDAVTGQELAWWERALGVVPVEAAGAGARAAKGAAGRAVDRVLDIKVGGRAGRAADAVPTPPRAGALPEVTSARPRSPTPLSTPVGAPEAPPARKVADAESVPRLDKGAQVPEGVEIPRGRLPELGMGPETHDAFQRVGNRYNAEFDVRPTNVYAPDQMRKGALPKPEHVKTKTIDDTDLLLNPRLTPEDRGLSAYFKPVDLPAQKPRDMSKAEWDQLKGRHAQRAQEYADQWDKMTFENPGKGKTYVDERGLVRDVKTGKPFAGDSDVFEVRSRDPNKTFTYEERVEITNALQREVPTVQHGAHRDWRYDPGDSVSRGIDEKILKSHQPGPDGEILIRIHPTGNPTAAYYHP